MTFEPPVGEVEKTGSGESDSCVTSSLRAKNESAGMIVSTRVIVH